MKPCGTIAAYARHIKNKEKPCEECAQASRDYQTTRRRDSGVREYFEAPCGTRSAYNRHLRRGEPTCQLCRDAQNKHIKEHIADSDTYPLRKHIQNTKRYKLITKKMTELDKEITIEYLQAIKNDCCKYCGIKKAKMQYDHVIPLSKGGTNHWWNIVRACELCNKSKGNKSLEDWLH